MRHHPDIPPIQAADDTVAARSVRELRAEYEFVPVQLGPGRWLVAITRRRILAVIRMIGRRRSPRIDQRAGTEFSPVS